MSQTFVFCFRKKKLCIEIISAFPEGQAKKRFSSQPKHLTLRRQYSTNSTKLSTFGVMFMFFIFVGKIKLLQAFLGRF